MQLNTFLIILEYTREKFNNALFGCNLDIRIGELSAFKVVDLESMFASSRFKPPTAEVSLEEKLRSNPYYPFSVVRRKEIEFSVRYRTLYVAIAGFLVSIVMLIAWITGNLLSNAFFVLPMVIMVVSLAAIWNYKDTRYYTLFPREKMYAFSHNRTVHVRGPYYNIYIRLRMEVRSGSKPYYHLVLNGYEIDTRRISGSSTNLEKLRRLGQKIAGNLNINYFDHANTSKHHVIRHFRTDKAVFTFRDK
ncbi:hypothetical protein BC830DRAFT_117992 [Chytriomyces sp. MP71]|nr:hypothetical protein BC830DRAFT_117992 [Chytriomyces sp. MP71]